MNYSISTIQIRSWQAPTTNYDKQIQGNINFTITHSFDHKINCISHIHINFTGSKISHYHLFKYKGWKHPKPKKEH